ncbi:MAG: LLM class F420-dependent oxidoreductase [Myxococcota bacterium]
MKFGILAPYQLGPLERGDYASAFGKLVEELGFESVWAVEHAVMCPDYESTYPYDPSGRSPFSERVIQPDPLIWLAYLAATTTRLRLATGVLILPQHNPVPLAKTLASLDRLSGGRMLLGIGVGWVREEAVALGTRFEDRGQRADEYVEVMRSLWREPVASFDGEFVRFERVVSEPRPVRSEGVPIIVGGHSAAAARRAGRLGDGFYPLRVSDERLAFLRTTMQEAAAECGRDASTIEITCSGELTAPSAEHHLGLGVDRLVVFPPTGDLDELRRLLEPLSREVIEKFA